MNGHLSTKMTKVLIAAVFGASFLSAGLAQSAARCFDWQELRGIRRPFLKARVLHRGRGCGATELAIMKVTGHKSSAMVREYIAEATLFENNATGMLGL